MKLNSLLAIVGMPGAGKTIAADFFRKHNIPVLRFGDQTDIGLKELNLPINEKNERAYRENLRKKYGMAAMAIMIEPRILIAGKDNLFVVLDGLYSWEEYLYLIKKFPFMKLLCIYAQPKKRYARLKKREIRPLNWEEAKSRDIAEVENLNKGGPIAISDYLIINHGSINDFYKQLELIHKEMIL